jgi:hypothetical protein
MNGNLNQLLIDLKESLEREMREGFARIYQRFDQVAQRFQALEARQDRTDATLTLIQIQTAGMSKSLADAERIDSRMTATQMAQQQMINDLARRVAKLEQRLEGR